MAAKGKGAATSKRGTLEQQSMQHTATGPGMTQHEVFLRARGTPSGRGKKEEASQGWR
jgi:hypothetical protein